VKQDIEYADEAERIITKAFMDGRLTQPELKELYKCVVALREQLVPRVPVAPTEHLRGSTV
jgi:hypothetical protein